jgi:hypothetical protein
MPCYSGSLAFGQNRATPALDVREPSLLDFRTDRRHTHKTALAPYNHAAADVVDELVLLYTVLSPFRVKYSLFCRAVFLSGTCYRHEIMADAATDELLIRDSFVIEPKMASRLVERRVDDRIFDDDLTEARLENRGRIGSMLCALSEGNAGKRHLRPSN